MNCLFEDQKGKTPESSHGSHGRLGRHQGHQSRQRGTVGLFPPFHNERLHLGARQTKEGVVPFSWRAPKKKTQSDEPKGDQSGLWVQIPMKDPPPVLPLAQENRYAFERYRIIPRVLVPVSPPGSFGFFRIFFPGS